METDAYNEIDFPPPKTVVGIDKTIRVFIEILKTAVPMTNSPSKRIARTHLYSASSVYRTTRSRRRYYLLTIRKSRRLRIYRRVLRPPPPTHSPHRLYESISSVPPAIRRFLRNSRWKTLALHERFAHYRARKNR